MRIEVQKVKALELNLAKVSAKIRFFFSMHSTLLEVRNKTISYKMKTGAVAMEGLTRC